MPRARAVLGWGRLLVACGVASGVLAGPRAAAAQELGCSVAVSGAQGTYSGDLGGRLSGLYVFAGVDLTAGPVRAWVSVPFMRSSNTPDQPLVPGTPVESQVRTGVGDPLLRVNVRVVDDRKSALQVAVAVSAKPSLVDPSEGLSTGATDVGGGVSIFKGLGRSSVFADILYWNYGDPEGIDYPDTLSYSVGFGRVLGKSRWSSMVSISGMSKAVGGGTPPMQLNLAALALAGRGQSLAISAGIGLNDTSHGFSLGTSWRIAFR